MNIITFFLKIIYILTGMLIGVIVAALAIMIIGVIVALVEDKK